MTNLLLTFFFLCSLSQAQTVPHATGVAHTDQVDLAYETFGAKGTALPIIAVNGGPGLSHAYMMQNDLWQRVGKNRFVVLYDQHGTGGSKRMQNATSQSMSSQVADVDTVDQALGLTKFVVRRGGSHTPYPAQRALSSSSRSNKKKGDVIFITSPLGISFGG